jgi:quinoprotein glucose dehydrogenase
MMPRTTAFALVVAAAACWIGVSARTVEPHASIDATPAVFRAAGADVDWPHVSGDPGGTRFSALDQINRQTVSGLEAAWTWRTGDASPDEFTTIECTPIVVDGVMFVTTARGKVSALDAARGAHFWTFDPFDAANASPSWSGRPRRVAAGVNRGVAYWQSGPADRRVFVGTADGRLIALDAATGARVRTFGDAGYVKLTGALPPEYADRPIGVTSAPAIIDDLVIVGVSVGEGPEPSAPGDLLAFDVRTGKLRWRFHTVPRPGEQGHETWEGDSWKGRGGANAWSGVTVDPERHLVFAGLGSPTFDFYGGDRKGDNLYGNSTIAVDSRTGERRWHYQVVRHDIWDYDIPTPPLLVRLTRDGRTVDAAAQVTKTGFVFVFDRVTGRPVFDIEDRPAPASDVPGERTSPTQPRPVAPPPFVRQTFTEADVFGTTPEAKAEALARFRQMRHGAMFTPPSLQGTVSLPGTRGGATWSGAAFDSTTGLLYVNGNEVANVLKLVPTPPGTPWPYTIDGYRQFLDRDGYPAITPPWGTVSAIDLNAGRIAWQVPLGEHPELAARGLGKTGTENFGGPIVTAGGLVFIGGAKDEKLHAYDAATGALVWERPLGAGGYATPATYSVGGRQFVVIAAGGGGKPRTRSGDAFVAFALKTGANAGRN